MLKLKMYYVVSALRLPQDNTFFFKSLKYLDIFISLSAILIPHRQSASVVNNCFILHLRLNYKTDLEKSLQGFFWLKVFPKFHNDR